jgi:hypothetical protein
MAIVYFVKTGASRDGNTSQGYTLSTTEIQRRLDERHLRTKFLNEEPPTIDETDPSDYFRYVVVAVANDDARTKDFSKSGFYLVENLDPKNAEFLIAPP